MLEPYLSYVLENQVPSIFSFAEIKNKTMLNATTGNGAKRVLSIGISLPIEPIFPDRIILDIGK
jgi:hypothetical protein